MNEFHRLEDDAPNDDFYFNVIGMIVTEIERRRITLTDYEWKFSIIQNETSQWTTVKYKASRIEEEFKLSHMSNPIGTIVFMNRCLKWNNEIELDFDEDELAVVALRPNEFQVKEFLKVFRLNYL